MSSLINAVYFSAKKREDSPPLPATWSPDTALERCHYAPMHTIFLGHVKSNYDICGKWLSAHEMFGTFGKQANKYLVDIKKLRCRRFFDAHPLSSTSWGTGVWVSENYLFWCRVQKLFLLLPAIHQAKCIGDVDFDAEVNMVLWFTMAAHACMSRLMSEDRIVPDMEHVIMLYLDTMVEMDRWIIQNRKKKKQTPHTDEGADDEEDRDTVEGNTEEAENSDTADDEPAGDDDAGSRNNGGCRKRKRRKATGTGGGKGKHGERIVSKRNLPSRSPTRWVCSKQATITTTSAQPNCTGRGVGLVNAR